MKHTDCSRRPVFAGMPLNDAGLRPHAGVTALTPFKPFKPDQSLGCGYPSPPDPSPSPNLSAPTLAAASLELKAEKQGAHSRDVNSVAFSPDGKTIVSGSDDKTLKVWDAGAWALIPLNPHAQN